MTLAEFHARERRFSCELYVGMGLFVAELGWRLLVALIVAGLGFGIFRDIVDERRELRRKQEAREAFSRWLEACHK